MHFFATRIQASLYCQQYHGFWLLPIGCLIMQEKRTVVAFKEGINVLFCTENMKSKPKLLKVFL